VRVALLVVRFGAGILGGAEQAARMLAERVADRPGWTVEVFTTCASDTRTWADDLAPGTTEERGVTVHRFASERGRDPRFDRFSAPLLEDPAHATPTDQDRWIDLQGPVCPAAVDAAAASHADVFVATPYLYWPTVHGVSRLADTGRPVVLHPAAHDEAPIRLPLFADVFARPQGLVFYTDGERRLVARLFPAVSAHRQLVLGLGVEAGPGDPAAFRRDAGVGDDPYLLCLGRVDDGKGALVLSRFFAAYKRRRPGRLRLVFAGPVSNRPPEHDDVVITGPLSEEAKWGALRGASVLVSPSPNESFSLVVLEAWAAGVPVMVHGRCPATTEHTRRSGGGLAFTGYASFEAGLDRLLGSAPLRQALAGAGRRYVEANFSWPVLIRRYADFLERVATGPGRLATIN
jgi:glycosyltransferase involved in cell wall biosynthesis